MAQTQATAKEIEHALDEVLAETNPNATIPLVHEKDDVGMIRGWLHLIVRPDREGLRAYDYVQELEEIERRLKQKTGYEELLVVPAMPD